MGEDVVDSLRLRKTRVASAPVESVEDKTMKERNELSADSGPMTNPRNVTVLLLISISLFLSFRIYSPPEPVAISSEKDIYAVVFDAGSTGTRIHVFQFEKNGGGGAGEESGSKNSFSIDLVDEQFDHVEPGLSAYADNPADSRAGLQRLLSVALDRIPASKQSSTPLILKATAGLRLLPGEKAEALLREVRALLAAYPFQFDGSENGNDVSVLDGVDEGFYGWITVNYLLDRLGGGGGGRETEGTKKVSTMDLGGGSTQVTYDLETVKEDDGLDAVPKDYIKSIDILGEKARLYTRSYLGLGIMAARLAILRRGTFRDYVTEALKAERNLVSSCLPPWYDDTWSFGGIEYRAKRSNMSDEFPNQCYLDATAVVTAAKVDKIPRRTIETSDFYGFSYYFDRLLEVGLIGSQGGEVKVKQIVDAASETCRQFPRDKRPFLCMDLSHIGALLTSAGLGFEDEDRIILRKKIAGKEASWSLGSAFSLIPDGR